MDTEPVKCMSCGRLFAVEIPGDDFQDTRLADLIRQFARQARISCNQCGDAHEGEIKAAKIIGAETAKQTSWQTLCPDEYKKEIDWKFKGAIRVNLEKVMAWNYGPKGLFVHGLNGKCKTRFMWRVLSREWNHHCRSIVWHGHGAFRIAASALAGSDVKQFKLWLDRSIAADILFMDDFGKGRSTPAGDDAMFALLDARMSRNLPVMYTTDLSLERLQNQFADEYSNGIMRRALQETDLVEF